MSKKRLRFAPPPFLGVAALYNGAWFVSKTVVVAATARRAIAV